VPGSQRPDRTEARSCWCGTSHCRSRSACFTKRCTSDSQVNPMPRLAPVALRSAATLASESRGTARASPLSCQPIADREVPLTG
jgi:hypothetical protein